ncbi:hypothetical protein [Acidianus sp. RZ1]|uniref:hypothetical protein n=1 Tax=Acidianus sp. RZ1 TaxID=1540082 RepID=UPI001490A884|nr:hypothetical protein [Acidianus sp. RZ1]NON63061.1 hypothetical protein [Acidianus sp. RZ1]
MHFHHHERKENKEDLAFKLYSEAIDLESKGMLNEAYMKIVEAVRLSPNPVFIFEMGLIQLKEGMREGIDVMVQAIDQAQRTGLDVSQWIPRILTEAKILSSHGKTKLAVLLLSGVNSVYPNSSIEQELSSLNESPQQIGGQIQSELSPQVSSQSSVSSPKILEYGLPQGCNWSIYAEGKGFSSSTNVLYLDPGKYKFKVMPVTCNGVTYYPTPDMGYLENGKTYYVNFFKRSQTSIPWIPLLVLAIALI